MYDEQELAGDQRSESVLQEISLLTVFFLSGENVKVIYLYTSTRLGKEMVSMLDSLSWMRHFFSTGYCLTFARGLDDAELFRRFGGDLSHTLRTPLTYIPSLEYMIIEEELRMLHERSYRQPMTDTSVQEYISAQKHLEELERASLEERLARPILQVGQCGDWAVAIEQDNGQGIRPQVLYAVSMGTVAVSLYSDIKCNTEFNYAEHGTLVVGFLLSPFHLFHGGDEGLARARELFRLAGIEPTNQHFSSPNTLFALAEASGVRLRLDQGAQAVIAERPLLTGEITPLPGPPWWQ